MLEAAIITRCKGRGHHLVKTLPGMLSQATNIPYVVVAVCYDDPDAAQTLLTSFGDNPRLCILLADTGYPYFNSSLSRNIGAIRVSARVLAFADADAMLDPRWLQHCFNEIVLNKFILVNNLCKEDTGGTMAVTSEAYHAVRGFCEEFEDWGYDDVHFCDMVKKLGPSTQYPDELCTCIKHDNALRTQYAKNQEVTRMPWNAERPASFFTNTSKKISFNNPHGYGISRVKIIKP